MPRYPQGGISALSQLLIDADKDWNGKGISNLAGLALGMIQGDMLVRGGGGVLIRIPAGVANTMWTSAGLGLLPFWGPGGTYLNRYFPATIFLGAPVVVIETPDRTDSEPAPISSVHVETVGDLPASGIKMLSPAVTMTNAEVNHGPAEQTNSKTPAVASKYDLTKVLDGAVAENTPAFADETAAAQNITANDMTLLPALPVANDAYYFGSSYKFDEMILNIGIAGNGDWTATWEYYDVDTTWHALAGVTDGTNLFRAAAGNKSVTFTRPGTWTAVAVGGVGPLFWIRLRIDIFTSIITQPKGTQSFYKITT